MMSPCQRIQRLAFLTVGKVLIFAFGVMSMHAEAQINRRGSSKELAFQVGTMWYTGDLNPTNVFRGRYHAAQGGFFRQNVNSRFAWRAQFMKGTIEAWDADHPNAWQQERNLLVVNEIHEYSVMAELNYRDYVVGVPRRRLMPFMMAGIAVYTHDPSSRDQFGNLVPLRPLSTEGQEWNEGSESYLLGGVAIPYGFGWKGTLGEGMSFQMEFGARKLWTDYLDDVSTVYMNPQILRSERGQTAVDFADMSETRELTNEQELAGLQRGDPGRNDRYGYFLFSLGFRVSKKPTTRWEQ